MGIEITTQLIHASYASVIREIDANANIYDNPNQQGTYYPAWFIVHRSPVELQKGIGRWTLVYQIDIWYMLKSNQTRLYDQYSAIAEQLDDKLEYLPIFGTDACVHVLDRSWGLELDALKYSTTLRLYASKGPKPVIPYMEVIEDLRVFLKNQKVEFCTLSFTNDEHPDFSVELPDDIIASVDSFVKLPSVSGEHEEGGELWVPNEWDIGAFGQPVKMANDITANLLWAIKPQYTLSFENTDYPQFDVELPEPITDYQGEEITLPTVAHQEFEDDGYIYWPLQWDIGAFGSKFVLNQDTDANLLWQSLKLVTITFANPDHPSFAIDLPSPITVRPGESVTLPSVTGEWTEGGITYTPSQWDIGAFGDSYTLNADTVAHLIFEEVQDQEIDIDVNFGEPVTVPTGYDVQSVKCSKLFVKASNVTGDDATREINFEYLGENLFCTDKNKTWFGVKVSPVIEMFGFSNPSTFRGFRLSCYTTVSGYATSVSASEFNSGGYFVKGKAVLSSSYTASTYAGYMQTNPMMFRLYSDGHVLAEYHFTIQNSVWSFQNGVFSWVGDDTDYSDLAYWYKSAPGVRVHCVKI